MVKRPKWWGKHTPFCGYSPSSGSGQVQVADGIVDLSLSPLRGSAFVEDSAWSWGTFAWSWANMAEHLGKNHGKTMEKAWKNLTKMKKIKTKQKKHGKTHPCPMNIAINWAVFCGWRGEGVTNPCGPTKPCKSTWVSHVHLIFIPFYPMFNPYVHVHPVFIPDFTTCLSNVCPFDLFP